MNAQDEEAKGKAGSIRLVRAVLADGTTGLAVEGYDSIDKNTIAGLKEKMIGTNPLQAYTWSGDRIQSLAPDYQDFLLDPKYAWFESALLDLAGRLKGRPVYALFGSSVQEGVDACDGTIHFKDIELNQGPEVIGSLATQVQEDGYRALKMKVGRLNKWMGTNEGLRRDVEAVAAARSAVGPNFNIMADANNGYQGKLRMGLQFLKSTDAHELYWIEELIPEKQSTYSSLRQTMFSEGLNVHTADGETAIWGDDASIKAAEDVEGWVRANHFDFVQPDLRTVGFSHTIRMADVASRYNAGLVPHNWQSELGKAMGVHLAKLRTNIPFVEDDRWSNFALDTSKYQFRNGRWFAPEAPGWGVCVNDHYDRFAKSEEEWSITA
jgi:L-alanine-DL-glutamate epimerase-like enolase superfamily enzyme